MPELPEVESVRRGLDRVLPGGEISRATTGPHSLRFDVAPALVDALVGDRFSALRRRGKHLLIDLDSGRTLLVHLGMSGRLFWVPAGDPIDEADGHVHFRLEVSGKGHLVYRDPRRFGWIRLGPPDGFVELDALGPDPMEEGWDASALANALRRTRRRVRDALLDQRLVAGVGNIYANEVLFRARVRPTRRGVRLRRREALAVAEAVPETLLEAVDGGGTSFSTFRDWQDQPGRFQDRLAVFRRDGEGCLACGAVVCRVVLGARSAFFCPKCQR